MPTFPENEGLIEGERAVLRQLMIGASREALRRYTMHPTSERYDEAPEGAADLFMATIDAGGCIKLLDIIRHCCAHTWISTDRHVCSDCGEIGPDS